MLFIYIDDRCWAPKAKSIFRLHLCNSWLADFNAKLHKCFISCKWTNDWDSFFSGCWCWILSLELKLPDFFCVVFTQCNYRIKLEWPFFYHYLLLWANPTLLLHNLFDAIFQLHYFFVFVFRHTELFFFANISLYLVKSLIQKCQTRRGK